MTTTFETAQIGDKVFDIYFDQWATITNIVKGDSFPIKTGINTYTMEGKPSKEYARTLFWDEVVITPPPKPLHNLEVDTKVIVWSKYVNMTKAYFSHFEKNGKIATFSEGRTSWSKLNGQVLEWEYWELAKDNKCQDS